MDAATLADRLDAASGQSVVARPLTLLGSGFRSIVAVDASETVFRAGKSSTVAKGYRMEMQLLPIVQKHVDVRVPIPTMFLAPSEEFPGGVLS
jgi:hypothetical protein